MPAQGANAALDRHNTELTIRALYIVFTVASTSEFAILGTTAIKNVWVHSATDIAASSKAQWSRFRERSLVGFIMQLPPIVWDLAMAYTMARIAMDDDNDTDLSALSFVFVNPNFLNEIVDPAWCWLNVHARAQADFSYTAFFDGEHNADYPKTIADLNIQQLALYTAKARRALQAALHVMVMPDGDLRYIMDGVETLNGACDPIGCLALVALHFLSLTDSSSVKNALSDWLSVRPRNGEHMRNFLQRLQEVRKALAEELSATGGTAITPQQVFDHVKFTIEDIHGNRYRPVTPPPTSRKASG